MLTPPMRRREDSPDAFKISVANYSCLVTSTMLACRPHLDGEKLSPLGTIDDGGGQSHEEASSAQKSGSRNAILDARNGNRR